MDLKIFDVEHGACALLKCDDNTTMMLDAGHNASTGWKPGWYLKSQKIQRLDMLTITNYDEDHVSGIENLFEEVSVGWLWRNKSVSTVTLKHLKSEDGMGTGIDRLCHAIDHIFTGDGTSPQPGFQGLYREAFHNQYPTFEDENNLSFVVHLNCHGVGVLFTGDLEKAGWIELLKQQKFREMLPKVRVLIAPHHGRESGCCEEAMQLCTSLNYVVISDRGYQYDTQKTIPFYTRFAAGGPFRGQTRKVLTTRSDGEIPFTFTPNGWGPY